IPAGKAARLPPKARRDRWPLSDDRPPARRDLRRTPTGTRSSRTRPKNRPPAWAPDGHAPAGTMCMGWSNTHRVAGASVPDAPGTLRLWPQPPAPPGRSNPTSEPDCARWIPIGRCPGGETVRLYCGPKPNAGCRPTGEVLRELRAGTESHGTPGRVSCPYYRQEISILSVSPGNWGNVMIPITLERSVPALPTSCQAPFRGSNHSARYMLFSLAPRTWLRGQPFSKYARKIFLSGVRAQYAQPS